MCSLAPSSVSTTTLHDLEDHADVALLVEWVFVDPQIEPRQLIDVLESAFIRYTGYCAAHFQPPECIVRIDRQDRHRRPARHVAVFLTALFRVATRGPSFRDHQPDARTGWACVHSSCPPR